MVAMTKPSNQGMNASGGLVLDSGRHVRRRRVIPVVRPPGAPASPQVVVEWVAGADGLAFPQ